MNIVKALKQGLPVQTRDGRSVRLVGILEKAPAPLVIGIEKPKKIFLGITILDDPYFLENYFLDGRYYQDRSSSMDLKIIF
jgi:hypothetical protein